VASRKNTLSYKLKLYPTRNKADCLAGLSGAFRCAHREATLQMSMADRPRIPSCKGPGEFVGRAYRRAAADFHKGRKAARVTHRPFVPPTLKAELIDAAQVQEPRQAKGFDLWVMIQGVGKFIFLPASIGLSTKRWHCLVLPCVSKEKFFASMGSGMFGRPSVSPA